MVREAKRAGMQVTCDVSVHHVHLSEQDIGYFDANCNLVPPLRSVQDRDCPARGARRRHDRCHLLRSHAGGRRCQAAAVRRSRARCDRARVAAAAHAEMGAAGGASRWPQSLARVTTAPLRVLGLAGGSLAAGAPADLCVFDPQSRWTVEPAALHSQGKNTPLLGHEVQGKVRYTLVDGVVVFDAVSENRRLKNPPLTTITAKWVRPPACSFRRAGIASEVTIRVHESPA